MVDISVKNLCFSYPGADKKTLENISFEINKGEFIILSGRSGSGKSTLLRMLKPELTPHGNLQGEITFFGKNKSDYSLRDSAADIGYLLQNTEYQTVTHSVRSELAFGAENLGLPTGTIRQRIAEISAYFSLDGIIDKKIDELSGGQKQLVCLAGILMMHPKVLIFDEPASQLDPMAAETLFSTANKLCKENGMTVIMTEHRLQSIIPYADRLIVLENGKILTDTKPSLLSKKLFEENEYINLSMPSPMRISAALNLSDELPLDIGGCRKLLGEKLKLPPHDTNYEGETRHLSKSYAIEAKSVSFAYDKSGYVLRNFSLRIPEGSFFAVLGANAAGKSTAISLLSGLLPCRSGKIKIFGKDIKKYKDSDLYNGTVAVLPQKCEALFAGNSVKEDLMNALSGSFLTKEIKEKKITETAKLTEISHILDRHPYDISGGEMQRAALAIVLLKNPRIVFMDEPTKGMDPLFKDRFAGIIKRLCKSGTTVITVSHDTEFCARHCDRCAMISDGLCVLEADSHEFFTSNYFYTTAANKTAREFFPDAVTEKEVIELCLKNLQS